MKYHTAQPKNQSLIGQKRYLLKHGIDTNYMFSLSDSFMQQFAMAEYPLFLHDTGVFRPIQLRSFDSLGKTDYNWSICYGFVDDFIKNCQIGGRYPFDVDSTLTLQDLGKMVNEPQKFQKEIMEADNVDLYVVTFWAKYLGTPAVWTLQSVESFSDTCQKNVRHIKLNLGKF
ncbi:MAG: hypothetical protein H6607_10105 [Flavobacteriales bacterium]|nr:hypothetical protein [Flavobacteriales bacterium]